MKIPDKNEAKVSFDTAAKPAFDAPAKSDSNSDSTDKESTPSFFQRSRKSNRTRRSRFNNSPRFRGAEEKMLGNVFQVDGEYGKKPNQFEKTKKAAL